MARRNVASETTLILTAGFSLIMIATFYFGDRTFLPLAETLDVRPTVVWVSLSALISFIWVLLHSVRLRPKVRQAQQISAELLYQYQLQRELELAKVRDTKIEKE